MFSNLHTGEEFQAGTGKQRELLRHCVHTACQEDRPAPHKARQMLNIFHLLKKNSSMFWSWALQNKRRNSSDFSREMFYGNICKHPELWSSAQLSLGNFKIHSPKTLLDTLYYYWVGRSKAHFFTAWIPQDVGKILFRLWSIWLIAQLLQVFLALNLQSPNAKAIFIRFRPSNSKTTEEQCIHCQGHESGLRRLALGHGALSCWK